MKRPEPLFALLAIFIVSISCTSPLAVGLFFSDINWDNIEAWVEDQDCETLEIELNGGDHSHVYVDEIKFSCRILEEGYYCNGPSSSLDPSLTVKIYEYGDRTNLKRTIKIDNERPWDKCDFDQDGVVDAKDGCPDDPDKIDPGYCGCWEEEFDSDGDAMPDCADECPDNPEKDSPGRCGCELSETDTDQDNMPDCLDDCPQDPNKEAPENCGCRVPEIDTDGDFAPDCIDDCPEDPEKQTPGICGCGVSDADDDGDGMVFCQDPCPGDAWHDMVGEPCDHDEDDDGTHDNADGCPFNPRLIKRNKCGCKTSCGDEVPQAQ
jgi:hypothetical protein